jgi:SAM-dependent methyltransferase
MYLSFAFCAMLARDRGPAQQREFSNLNMPHRRLVTAQFGPRATDYVKSAVHAAGADLDRLTRIVRCQPAARVLDLGCGGGYVSARVAPYVREAVAFDLSPGMLDAVTSMCRERGFNNVLTCLGAAEDLPFKNQAFDFVISRYSAHHWHDVPRALREARRVLAPGGRPVFIDVVSPASSCGAFAPAALLDTFLQAIELLRDPSHVRDYSIEEWQHALADAGFTPGPVTRDRLRLDFSSWVERMATPATHISAIRSLQSYMTGDVKAYFEIETDGSFTIDTMFLEAR